MKTSDDDETRALTRLKKKKTTDDDLVQIDVFLCAKKANFQFFLLSNKVVK